MAVLELLGKTTHHQGQHDDEEDDDFLDRLEKKVADSSCAVQGRAEQCDAGGMGLGLCDRSRETGAHSMGRLHVLQGPRLSGPTRSAHPLQTHFHDLPDKPPAELTITGATNHEQEAMLRGGQGDDTQVLACAINDACSRMHTCTGA
jgi:hypothetical protein